jgi:invasion protein IalB
VKLCEKAPVVSRGPDGKDVKTEKSLCLTHHERLDGNTGMVLVSAAIRTVEGSPKKSLMIMVPLGMAIPPGIRAAVYTKDQWAAAAKGGKIDEKQLKPIELRYALCHPAGCTAETEATPEILDEMSKGGGIMVLAMNAAAQPIGFPVPLDGYNEATAGPPVDNKKYAEARSQLMAQIRQHQQQAAAEQFKASQLKNLPLDGPGAPETTSSTKK